MADEPVLGLTGGEAAEILGISRTAVDKAVFSGRLPKGRKHARAGLDRDDLERLSLERLKYGRPHPYWATTNEAAQILGVSRTAVAGTAGVISSGSSPTPERPRPAEQG